ncbi:RNA polymerase sigma factor [Faecalibacterium sp. An192]|uniref:RNA polymerase sigma factor n=1 Tax=Faecalibacterium sp. An192 TaxID=1965581 RepID=UPI000B37B583|nr:RNA polymerase sigma factor [Faecalibacterium sp. An192]OUP27069.1 hypothetical protein B5F27_11445 [Faecalibacterium sp. An192]
MGQSDQNIPELVLRAKSGDQQAMEQLYEMTYSRVYCTIQVMVKDEQETLDLLQDSYIKAFKHLNQFEGGEKFLPWMQQIARNTAKDWLKKKHPAFFTDLRGEKETEWESPAEEQIMDANDGSWPEKVLDREETARLIREILDGLPEDQRVVIEMFYYEELSVKQIALTMGLSESAVKSRLFYGRRKIETKVLALEKKGTKLYGLAPIPFLLWLLRCQGEGNVLPNKDLLRQILAKTTAGAAAAAAHTAAAGTTGAKTAGSGAAAKAGLGARAFGSLGAAKLVVIALAAAAGVGLGAYGLVHLALGEAPQPASMAGASSIVQAAVADSAPLASEAAKDLVEQALEAYKKILSQADSYTYTQDSVTPTGRYQYALVQLEPEDPVPTLLLSQETEEYLWFIRVFQYDPESGTVLEPPESLTEGVAEIGGYRGGLGQMADGRGLRTISVSGGTGATVIDRITLEGEHLVTITAWGGSFANTIPEEFSFVEIQWHDGSDTAPLDRWPDFDGTSGGENKTETSSSQSAASQPGAAAPSLPEDGNRIVFTGTVDSYSYQEVVNLQGCPDPNAPWTDTTQTFQLIVLDTPQVMELETGDPSPASWARSGEVRLIDVSLAEGLESFDGQHLTFSIDPEETYWPSDASMPVGQPSTRDVHILN